MTRLLEHLTAGTGERERREVEEATELKFVGPVTGDAIEEAGFVAQDIVDKNVSYRMLLEAGVNPGVAAKIRRYHSLSWSFDADGDLNRRSEQVRGLQDAERAWVADSGIGADEEESSTETPDAEPDGEAEWVEASSENEGDETEVSANDDGEAAWVANSESTATSADGSGDPLAAEAAWRERSKPTPLTEISGIGESYSTKLAEAGVTSVRSLATADPELLSDVTGIPIEKVASWHHAASDLAE